MIVNVEQSGTRHGDTYKVKAKELLEGIQRRTKQEMPGVIKYQNTFFAVGNGWTKQQLIYSMSERMTEAPYWDDNDERKPLWMPLIDRQLQPKDISDKDMKQFVLDWAHATDNFDGDAMYNYQEKALEELARKI